MTVPRARATTAAPPTRPSRFLPPDAASTIVALTAVLWLSCLVLCYALLATPVSPDPSGQMKLTESVGALERVALWQGAMDWLPLATWPKAAVAWTARVAIASMFAVHVLAFAAAWHSRALRPWLWLVGPIGAQVIMLLMVPSNADVFFYALSGDIANDGRNPYTTHLYEVFQHPLYPFNHWVDMTTVYGPVWTVVNQMVMTIAGDDPVRAVVAYKILLGSVAVVVAAGTYGAARLIGIGARPATAAMVLAGWQPNMIIEAAGQAHNDVVMIAFMLAAVALALAGASRATRGGIVLATVSVAVKYVALPVLTLLALTRLDRRAPRRVASAWLLDLLAIIAVLVAAFGPYWTDLSILREMISEPGRLYTNPLWHIPASALRAVDDGAGAAFESATRVLAQVAAILAIALVLVRFGVSVWRTARCDLQRMSYPMPWTRPLLQSWALVMAILAFVPVNTHAWYWTWPVVPVALLIAWEGRQRSDSPPRWLWGYLAVTAILTIVYHTRIVHA